ncbi:MAG: class I SAM-dependent methyltransferase [Spirochaetales bacterium]|nr:class I SAM-dependent methyltransferase [Leptospiraceae bacterium]MCP5480313.1 class I SAM-dependent methyltransferase [Spirochaetales bacterium]
MILDRLLERGLLPDFLIRLGIRSLLRVRLRQERQPTLEQEEERNQALFAKLRQSAIAVHTQDANDQHYELPPEFFELVLGKNRKYSSAYYEGAQSLDAAEDHMLRLTAGRADLKDGQQILELGCGWGSLTIFMARSFPRARITAVSNSAPQRIYIEQKLAEQGLQNVRVITADMNEFAAPGRYDRVVSVEMFEHMRNYELLFGRIAEWLKPGGKLFVHIFTHADRAYLFEDQGESDWMARYFFTGGIMPSKHLLLEFCYPLKSERIWTVDGTHYQRTSEDWLRNMDRHRDQIMQIFVKTYGPEQARRWWNYWRVFFMSVAELFGYAGGREWQVNHYLFSKAPSRTSLGSKQGKKNGVANRRRVRQ